MYAEVLILLKQEHYAINYSMPQFDLFSFSGQNIWVLITFFFLYFFLMYFYVANYSEMFKMRQKLLSLYSTEDKANAYSFVNLYDFFFSKSIKS